MADYTEETPEVKKPAKKKKKRRKKHYFLRFLIFIALITAFFVLISSSLFNVTGFRVAGNKYYTSGQVQELCGISTGKNIIFETRLKDARDKLLESPYIKTAKLSRSYPGTVVIEVEERQEYAAVPFGERYIIIDADGMVLRLTEIPPEIPVVEGFTILDAEEGKPLSAEQGYLLNGGLNLMAKAEGMDFYFERIDLSAVSVKAYIYYNQYYCEGSLENISANLSAIKAMVEDQYQNGISHGKIIVGSNGYLSFAP